MNTDDPDPKHIKTNVYQQQLDQYAQVPLFFARENDFLKDHDDGQENRPPSSTISAT